MCWQNIVWRIVPQYFGQGIHFNGDFLVCVLFSSRVLIIVVNSRPPKNLHILNNSINSFSFSYIYWIRFLFFFLFNLSTHFLLKKFFLFFFYFAWHKTWYLIKIHSICGVGGISSWTRTRTHLGYDHPDYACPCSKWNVSSPEIQKYYR